ncbi:hypothetical protein [Candidatus Nanohalococcus occultus]|uniref:hypothetical protein n=1 Tax=Candidatus Nanohalococcus occultus TaxID=2978047 RepID=UPI0039E11505
MKKHTVVLTALMLLGVQTVTAQSNQLDKGPGMIGAESPVYGLEVAMDNAAVSIGLAKAGEIAKERAAEAQKAADNNNTAAAAKAGKQLEKVAQRAGENESESIEVAMNSFQDTITEMEMRIDNAPNENAREGMETALENMRNALQNMEQARQRGNQTGSQRPENISENRPNRPDRRPGNMTEEQEADDNQTAGNITGENNPGENQTRNRTQSDRT